MPVPAPVTMPTLLLAAISGSPSRMVALCAILRLCRPFVLSALAVHQLDERLDVADGEGERLRALFVARDGGNVVGHDHPVVANLLVDAHRPDHVHVAVVREGLLEVEELALDVAEVDVEDLVPLPEVADDVVDLL